MKNIRSMRPTLFKKFLSKLRYPQPKGAGYISYHARIAGKNPENIFVGASSYVANGAFIFCSKGTIEIGGDSVIDSYAKIRVNRKEGFIKIGDFTFLHEDSFLNGDGGITIGSKVRIGQQVGVTTANHNFDRPGDIMGQGISFAPVVIEDDVWIGMGAKILPGVRIGAHSVIGAGAVVTRDIPPSSVAVGVPAKVIKTR